ETTVTVNLDSFRLVGVNLPGYLPGGFFFLSFFSVQELSYVRSCPVATCTWYAERTKACYVLSVFSLRHPRDFKSNTIPKGNLVPGIIRSTNLSVNISTVLYSN
ncbi:unnamed protein product, partial [Laminaria digitata]